MWEGHLLGRRVSREAQVESGPTGYKQVSVLSYRSGGAGDILSVQGVGPQTETPDWFIQSRLLTKEAWVPPYWPWQPKNCSTTRPWFNYWLIASLQTGAGRTASSESLHPGVETHHRASPTTRPEKINKWHMGERETEESPNPVLPNHNVHKHSDGAVLDWTPCRCSNSGSNTEPEHSKKETLNSVRSQSDQTRYLFTSHMCTFNPA